MDKKISIKLTSADGVLPNISRDENAIRNINEWLAPIADELIKQNVTLELYVDTAEIQHLIFSDNISSSLYDKAQKELGKYQFRLANRNPKS